MTPENSAKPVPQLILVTSTDGEAAKVHCTGKLITGTTAILQTEIRALLPGSKRIVLDLTDLGYMDSTGLGSVIAALKLARSSKGDLRLAAPNQQVRVVLELTTLDRVFAYFATVEDALTDF